MGNFIEEYNNVLPAKLCDYLINKFETGNNYLGVTGGGYMPEFKDAQDFIIKTEEPIDSINTKEIKMVNKIFNDKFLNYLEKYKYDMLLPYPLKPNESLIDLKKEWAKNIDPKCMVMHRYNPPNQGYHGWHQDWAVHSPDFSRRILVGMIYLNDVDEGGETEFYHQEVKIKPTQGTMVVWPAFFTHAHRGNRPISNTKYIINKWCYPKFG